MYAPAYWKHLRRGQPKVRRQTMTIIFDSDKYRLGKLCKYEHDYHGTGQSLRHKKYRWCVECVYTRIDRPPVVHLSLEDTFNLRVDKSEDCWNWTGGISKDGYGMFCWKLKYYKAHRLAYELAHGWGSLPNDLCICHHCDNRLCVRPDHLFLGTNADNVKDKLKKGRQPSKLLKQDVLDIRARYSQGVTQSQLAQEYKVEQTTISHIILRKNWKHI